MKKALEEYSDAELFYLMHSDKKIRDKAFTELYNRLSPRVYAYCRRFIGDKETAQDVFQETFVKFFESSKQDRIMTNVPGFILKIARNVCLNYKRQEEPAVSYEDYMAMNYDNRTEKDELLNLIKTALVLLPDEYREVFILREYEGLSYSEIAEITNTSLAAIKVRIFRAKQRIREILNPYLEDLTKV